MKSSHVALVVSALAMTASGVSIGQLPPSPTKLSQNSKEYESGPGIEAINRRRPARGPLPRTHKRAKGSKNLLQEENRTLSKGNDENELPTFEEYINSLTHPTHRNLRSASAQLNRGNAKHANPNSARKAIASVAVKATSSDIPGFVDIALPDLQSGVARTVSGLAYSMNSGLGGELELGTSASHSTQFFMSPIKSRPGSSLYRLRVPVMDSATFQTTDHCATFPISPAGPLSLKKCGSMPGFSQTFSYDAASGELQPVYHDDSNSNLATNDQNVLNHQIHKRDFSGLSNCDPASAPLSKRDGTPSSSQPPSALFYFVPAQVAKTGASIPSKNSDQ
ncbi:hypothetical protein PGT21_029639 [Puccinia graminis f. sp. tritici]|uniref:Uncharacterized protein n=2 Tax=Puccinia graminis f. sp. tritici TaxID=56615 RepID=E3KQ26_PUCGT|nr:uncharacterized protein PGTG_12357 [Puccinia graminis f. sp. tritici CRL 75-36-700-3]EFP86401.1 hypothetical protein PGTG_12357 [Puccinia graminis f. sp. tritici CRL 75-36-700-3]KAA1113368.1 hypothetical protein PGT21_029639 [Puccinia graminis f. sp. tritici]